MKRNETGETNQESRTIKTDEKTGGTNRSVSSRDSTEPPTGSAPTLESARILTANMITKGTILSPKLGAEKHLPVKTPNPTQTLNTFHPKPRQPQFIKINVSTMMGKTFEVELMPTDTIADLKYKIDRQENIPAEAQQLVFCGKQLDSDIKTLYDAGIRAGSKIQLVIQMAGGPGPPIIPRPISLESDQTVFLLCKQNQELYVLEVQLMDGDKPRKITKHHLHLESLMQSKRLMELLGSNECFDLSDICELQIDMDAGSTAPSSQIDENEDYRLLRPSSGISDYSFGQSLDSSRPVTSTTDSSIDESFENLFWDSEWQLSEEQESSVLSRMSSETSIRPATAISLMRLPDGKRPMVILPKTRPASAEKWIADLRSKIQVDSEALKTPKKTSEISATPPLDFFQSNSFQPTRPSSRQTRTSKGRKSRSPKIEFGSEPLLQFSSQECTTRKLTPKRISTTSRRKTPKPVPLQKQCCLKCSKKLGPAQTFVCKCKESFCAAHRYSDRHECSFDYKTEGKAVLQKNNPLVKNDKCIRL